MVLQWACTQKPPCTWTEETTQFAAVWRHLRIHWLTCRHGYPCSAEILANAEQLKTHSDLLVPGLSGCSTNRHSM